MKSIHHLPLPALSCLYAVLLVTAFSYSCSGYSMHVSSTKQFHVFQHKVKTVGAIGLSPKGRQNTGREALSSNVQHPKTTRAFDDLVWGHQNDLVVVDFSAKWCGPCKMIAPVYDEISVEKQNGDVMFIKVDVDECPEIASRYQVKSMPTFLFIKNKEEIGRFSGANIAKLKENIALLS